MWGAVFCRAIRGDVAITHIVDEDDDEVWLGAFGRHGGRCKAENSGDNQDFSESVKHIGKTHGGNSLDLALRAQYSLRLTRIYWIYTQYSFEREKKRRSVARRRCGIFAVVAAIWRIFTELLHKGQVALTQDGQGCAIISP
jgi:hypothetical protein